MSERLPIVPATMVFTGRCSCVTVYFRPRNPTVQRHVVALSQAGAFADLNAFARLVLGGEVIRIAERTGVLVEPGAVMYSHRRPPS